MVVVVAVVMNITVGDGRCAGRGDDREREQPDDELESEGSLMSVDGCWLCFPIR